MSHELLVAEMSPLYFLISRTNLMNNIQMEASLYLEDKLQLHYH